MGIFPQIPNFGICPRISQNLKMFPTNGRILTISPRFCKLWGCCRTGAKLKGFSQIFLKRFSGHSTNVGKFPHVLDFSHICRCSQNLQIVLTRYNIRFFSESLQIWRVVPTFPKFAYFSKQIQDFADFPKKSPKRAEFSQHVQHSPISPECPKFADRS